MKPRFLLHAAVSLAAAAVILAVSGGVRTTVGGLRISARSPVPLAAAALVAGAAWLVSARRQKSAAADLEQAYRSLEQHSTRVIVLVAVAVTLVAAAFATRSAAGADASGYVSQAAMWTRGELFASDPLSAELRSTDGWLTTPLGWRPASAQRQAPTYAPGLPLLMAVPHFIGGVSGAASVVIASAAVAIIATGVLAARLSGGIAGIIAALFLGVSPVFIFQSIQPMSDVPVTAAWMLCFVLVWRARASDLAAATSVASAPAGFACALAVLIRPNLAPLAIVPWLLAQNKIAFAIPVAVAGAFLAFMQWTWYGSPLRSGYGSTDELFAIANVVPNLSRYFHWLVATAPAMLLAVLGCWRARRHRVAQALGAFALLVAGAYLVYAVFDDWSYLRFLLPALAVMAVLAATELAAWIERWPVWMRAPLLAILLLGVTAHGVFVARSLDTFRLEGRLRRVTHVAEFVLANVPRDAVIVSGEQSGSMRYYTGRPILRWEAASPDALTTAIERLDGSGRPVYIALDAWEEGPFRAKFAGRPHAALDWPPVLEAGTSHRTRLWKVADRDRFRRGEPLNTLRLP